MMKTQYGVLLMVLCGLAYADAEREDKNPLGCRDLGYHFVLKTLDLTPPEPEGTASLFFMFNKTTQPIQLSQMRPADDTEEISINHIIPPKQWAVLAMDHQHVKYACSISDGKSPYGQIVDCATSLQVCDFARVKYGLNNRGNFWMVKGNSKNGALQEVTNYGVIAR